MSWFDLSIARNVRDFGAIGSGDRDDAPNIQAAIDSLSPEGGTVFIPAGTYRIGSPTQESFARTNTALLVGSHVRLIGEGPGRTILRMTDNARQAPPHNIHAERGTSATLIVNRGNAWWWRAWNEPVPPADDDIVIANMTLDGNKDAQPVIYEKGNRTRGRIANPVPPLLSAVGVADPRGGDVFHQPFYQAFYQVVGVTYATSDEQETSALSYGSVRLEPDHNAIEFDLPPTPQGAQMIFVYLGIEQDGYSNWWFRRVGPFRIPEDRRLVIPLRGADGADASLVLPPDTWRLPLGAAHGIFLSNVCRCLLVDLEIKDCVGDGLTIQGTVASDEIHAERLFIHDCRRWGLTLEGPARDLHFNDCQFVDNSAAADIAEEGYDIRNLRFTRCVFRNNAVFVSPMLGMVVEGLEFVGCRFDAPSWSTIGLNFKHSPGQVGQVRDARISGCVFEGIKGIALATGASGGGVVEGCSFIENGKHPVSPICQIMFKDPRESTTWVLQGNHFRPPENANLWPIIQVAGQDNRLELANNLVEPTDAAPHPILLQLDDGSPETNHTVGWNPGVETP